MEETLAGLGKRIFLMHDVHEDGPVVFETRWTLSYLRGPITRQEIRRIVGTPAVPATAPAQVGSRPVLPPGIPEHFVPLSAPVPAGSRLVMVPMVLGVARIGSDETSEEVALLSPIPPDWSAAFSTRTRSSYHAAWPVTGSLLE